MLLFINILLALLRGDSIYWENLTSEKQNDVVKEVMKEDLYVSRYLRGEFHVSDNSNTDSLFTHISDLRKKNDIKSYYFYLFNQFIDTSDGAVLDLLCCHISDLIMSEPKYVMTYLRDHPELSQKYSLYLAYSLAVSDMGVSTNNYDTAVHELSRMKEKIIAIVKDNELLKEYVCSFFTKQKEISEKLCDDRLSFKYRGSFVFRTGADGRTVLESIAYAGCRLVAEKPGALAS